MARYYNEQVETASRDQLFFIQSLALTRKIKQVYNNVELYRRRMDEAGIRPEDIKSAADLSLLPFTYKQDLRDTYPYGMFAVPLREVVRIHASACMTTVVGYTRNDIKTWSNLVARVLVAGGVGKDDVVQIAYQYDLSTGGFGIHFGAERIGASVIPTSTGNTARQIKIMRDFKTTALVATPSYALHIANAVQEAGIGPGALSLRYGLFGGEPWSETLRQQIQDRLHIVATDNYGVSEVIGPGVASECTERKGLHINEDHFLVEVVDPKTLEPVPMGQTGELVITTLTKEAFPVIRFRTRDLTSLISEPCACGRKTLRMARVNGRSDDILIIRGTNVAPAQIAAVLGEIEGQVPPHQIVVERPAALDELTVLVAPSETGQLDELRKQHERLSTIEHRLASELGLSINVKLVERKSVESGPRVLDKRKV